MRGGGSTNPVDQLTRLSPRPILMIKLMSAKKYSTGLWKAFKNVGIPKTSFLKHHFFTCISENKILIQNI